jgi:hypothetical protein
LLIQILTHTPMWVFGLFFGLVYVGLLQSRDRSVSRMRLAVLPLGMACLSLGGVWTSFGASVAGFSAWTLVLLAVVACSLGLGAPRGVAYDRATKRFSVPGSWLPLVLMMCIFFTKYAVAVARAFDPAAAGDVAVVGGLCALYGLFSGVFLARALRFARVARREPLPSFAPTAA